MTKTPLLQPGRARSPALSVVIPVHNEAENLGPLAAEVHAALGSAIDFEIVFVDDGSSDETKARLAVLAQRHSRLRVLRHRTNVGQSTALLTGVRHGRGALIATLDGDGQNDPADIPRLLVRWKRERAASSVEPLLLAGWRASRRDSWLRRLSSRIANGVRSRLLGDGTPDTGCGLKLFARDEFLTLPGFDHMHRFLPALFLYQGGRVVSVLVGHRPRLRGLSHYGIRNRLFIGLVDLAGVMWLRSRTRVTTVEEPGEDAERSAASRIDPEHATHEEPAWNTIRSG